MRDNLEARLDALGRVAQTRAETPAPPAFIEAVHRRAFFRRARAVGSLLAAAACVAVVAYVAMRPAPRPTPALPKIVDRTPVQPVQPSLRVLTQLNANTTYDVILPTPPATASTPAETYSVASARIDSVVDPLIGPVVAKKGP